MKVIYSFNKIGFEADYWGREISGASTPSCELIPFNHGTYADINLYIRAQLLDSLYFAEHPGLMAMYADLERVVKDTGAEVLLVDNCPPYHPEFLKRLGIYKVLRTSDGPVSAYDRDFAYVHAYDHVLYHSPAYSRDMGMAEKLAYVGARRTDFWPLALFDAMCDPAMTEADIESAARDIDIIFVGGLYPSKMPLLAKVKRIFGKRFVIRGVSGWKRNLYFNAKYGFPGWVRPIDFSMYRSLYRRAKIGINAHNRGKYTVGSYRLFDLPGNGVMQISDGGEHLQSFFDVGSEIEGYESTDELIGQIEHYLANDADRQRIAVKGLRRVRRDHTLRARMAQLESILSGPPTAIPPMPDRRSP